MSAEVILIAWIGGAIASWPIVAIGVARSDVMVDSEWRRWSGFDWGIVVWWSLGVSALAWPLVVSSMAIAKVVRRRSEDT